jgi:hypothetical protein
VRRWGFVARLLGGEELSQFLDLGVAASVAVVSLYSGV